MKKARWRKFALIWQLPVSTPGQQAMNYYFQCPTNGKQIPSKETNNTAQQ